MKSDHSIEFNFVFSIFSIFKKYRDKVFVFLERSLRWMCNRAGNSPKIPWHAPASWWSIAVRWMRWGTFLGSASHFFPNTGVLEKDAAFKTSDIFESKVLQWRSETFLRPSQGSLFWREAVSDVARYLHVETHHRKVGL